MRLRGFLVAGVGGLVLTACASLPSSSADDRGSRSQAVHTTATTTTSTTATTEDPGALPQTDALPAPDTAQFAEEMAALWQGVTDNSVAAAMPALFPEAAYVQVKAISNPEGDYQSRLIGAFGLDLGAAHALLGTKMSSARLLGVHIPSQLAHWVPPGTCYNRVGYYEVPNSRVVYGADGDIRSFGIASMISWRGNWYVVHLGAVVRTNQAGEVDDPEQGPGTSAPSSTC